MRASRRYRAAVAVTTALVLAAAAGPVGAAAPTGWLSASPTASPIALAAGGSVTVTITNTDRRTSSTALTVSLATNPSDAPFAIANDGCAGRVLRPGDSCTVDVRYSGIKPSSDHAARLTVSSGKPAKASVVRIIEVGVSFEDVCIARGGTPSQGGTITLLNATFAVDDRCDWGSVLANAVYNATFEALSPECFDLGNGGMIGYPVNSETGKTAMGCVAD